MKKNVLFVDDEQSLLDGLERMLYGMSDEWDMTFVTSGEQALVRMGMEHYDGIVSDMRMPGMDGAELLSEVKRLYPQTIRFVLTGHADDEAAIRSADLAHQFLNKPCDPGELEGLLKHALSLRKMSLSDGMKKLVTSLSGLPSLPKLYGELVAELNRADPSLKTAADIVSRDVAMSAKVLQLVNSAFFGLRNEVTDLTQAATLLGLDTLKDLVLVAHAFSVETGRPLPPSFSQRELSAHSLLVGNCAKSIVADVTDNITAIQESFTAGMLHDLGKLILAVNRPDEYESVCADVRLGIVSSVDAEQEVFGCTHCDVGAYLLGLWGLPDTIVEAVAYHHEPQLCDSHTIGALTAVHVADALIRENEAVVKGTKLTKLDVDYVAKLRLTERIDDWRELCRRSAEEVLHVS